MSVLRVLFLFMTFACARAPTSEPHDADVLPTMPVQEHHEEPTPLEPTALEPTVPIVPTETPSEPEPTPPVLPEIPPDVPNPDCDWSAVENFDVPNADWKLYGNATWDAGGWLELTGNMQTRKGAVFNVARNLDPGDIVLRFRVSMGQCDVPDTSCTPQSDGADGLALSVFHVADESELSALLTVAQPGGGLGYGVGGEYGNYAGDALHIEFDTWYNIINGVELHTDPTRSNHIAITMNGDPGHHVLWRAMPALDDNRWHDVELQINGAHVTVLFDGQTIIDDVVTGLRFKGGFLGFTASTGFYTNHHRFDDLQFKRPCE